MYEAVDDTVQAELVRATPGLHVVAVTNQEDDVDVPVEGVGVGVGVAVVVVLVQVDAPAVDVVPVPHVKQELEPALLKVPAAQLVQAVAEVVVE